MSIGIRPRRRLVALFAHQLGVLGRIAGWNISHRGSNVARNRRKSLKALRPLQRIVA
jgi:hypothetical protein